MTNLLPKPSVHNYLLTTNGATIISNSSSPLSSSQMKKSQNILTSNIRQVWLSDRIPAQLVVDLRNLYQKCQNWNRVGFYCWNQLTSNPKVIQVSYKTNKQSSWQLWSKLKIQFKTGWQQFILPTTSSNKVNFLRINVLQNYSQNGSESPDFSTYLNAAMLGYKEDLQQLLADNPSGILHREKTFSDYRKLTSSQKQLKKMHEKIRNLTSEHDLMKKTIDQQSSIIIKLQQTIQNLTDHVQKLFKIQQSQQKRLKKYQKQKDEPLPPHKVRDFFNDQSEIVNKAQYKYKQKNSKQMIHQLQQIPESKASSLRKNKQRQNAIHSIHKKGQKSIRRQVVHLHESDSLSEYQDPLSGQGKSKLQKSSRNSQKASYKPMLEKLTRLLMLKEEKKKQIRSQQKSRRTHQQQQSSQEDEYIESQIQYRY